LASGAVKSRQKHNFNPLSQNNAKISVKINFCIKQKLFVAEVSASRREGIGFEGCSDHGW
jgi:hypothetical protein